MINALYVGLRRFAATLTATVPQSIRFATAQIIALATISVALALALVFSAQPIFAQSDAWSPPLRLSPLGAMASFPDIVADAAGGAHVVWSSTDDRYDLVIYTELAQNAAAWGQPVDIVANAHNTGEYYVSRPSLTIGADWKLTMGVHAPGDQLDIASAPAADARDPFAWTTNILGAAGYHVAPLAADSLLHVVYTQGVSGAGCPQCLHLYYANSSDSGESWSDPVDVSRRQDLGAAKPKLLRAAGGALHLVWESGMDGDRGYVTAPVRVMYAASYDEGATWSPPYELDALGADDGNEQRFARNVTISQAGDGSLVAAWWQMPEDIVFYRTSGDEGRTWSDERSVPSVWGVGTRSRTRQDTYSSVTDSSGVVHLLMVGRLGEDDASVALLHLSYLGGTWSYPRVVATYDADLPEWPRVAVGLGNRLRVVWHLRPNALLPDGGDAQWEVWEADVLLSSPSVAAVAMPAPAEIESSVSTSAPASPPTATTAPTLMPADVRAVPASPVTMETLMSENDDVALLALALVPAVALVFVALYWRRRKARG